MLPWSPTIIDQCFHSDTLRVAYTNMSPTLDRIICFYVHFNQQVLHDIVGLPLMRLLMAALGTCYAIMAFEGSRKGFKTTTLLIAFPILGLLANMIGISLMFPAIWIPLCLYSYKQKEPKGDDLSLSMPEAYGILLGIVVGYGVPSAIIASPWITNDSRLEQDLVCLWQVLPVIIVPLFGVFENVFKKMGSPIDQITQPAVRERLHLVEGKDALERCFLFLGVLNMVIYYGSYVVTVHQGIHIWDSFLLLLNAPGSLPAGLSFEDLGKLLSTRMVLIDYISLSISFVLWATFNSGIIAGLSVFIATPIIGPAAALSFYSYYRESKMQHTIIKAD
ncbi:hypothetical protein INT48_004871 [Thamnidium elegans]|uniref:Uncharacterized protein n=1 Tax=Thamnidium elegans TaxID=101142 RepID=A0A8H7SUC9_9FUNG|nr:hypothetical protein INT48_004871 [Thamnidium elegans]